MPRIAAAAAALAVAATAALPVPAHAGAYPMHQCRQPDGRRAEVTDRWRPYGFVLTVDNACGAGGTFGARITAAGVPFDSGGGIAVAVPAENPHTRVRRVWASFDSGAGPWWGSAMFYRWFAGGQLLFDGAYAPWAGSHEAVPPTGARDLALDLYCSHSVNGQGCATGNPQRALQVHSLSLTLSEEGLPDAAVSGGSLLAAGPRRGVETLAYAASDADSGITAVAVQLGGVTVARDGFAAHCTHQDFNACPKGQQRSGLEVDTRAVADGSHPLRLVVSDAAGNARTVDSGRTIAVANDPQRPVGGGPLPGGGAAPSPPGASGAATPGGQPGATAGAGGDTAGDRGPHNGSGAAARGVLVSEWVNRRRTITTRFGRAVELTGRLTQEDGTPIEGAQLEVHSRGHEPGAATSDGDRVVTDREGRWRYLAGPGASRTIRVHWRAFAADRSYAETTEAELLVRAGVRLTARPVALRNGGSVRFSGRLLGGPIPRGGVLVGLQVRVGKRWRTFGLTRADALGRFRYRYRFTRTRRPARFAFRARAAAQEAYPYVTGTSPARRVRVRP